MTQTNILELAKQGDVKAIAALMNRQLQPKGITAKVAINDSCLQIMLEFAQVPDQQTLVGWVRKSIIGLGTNSIERVKIYGRQTGEEFPAWSHEFELAGQHLPSPNSTVAKFVTLNAGTQQQPSFKKQEKQGDAEVNTKLPSNSSASTYSHKLTGVGLWRIFQRLSQNKKIALTSSLILLIIFLLWSGWLVLILRFIFALSLLGLLPISVVFWLVSNAKKRAKKAQEYEDAKEALRKNTGDARLREAALNAGRSYYASLRHDVLSIYDEQALTNDLSMIVGSIPEK